MDYALMVSMNPSEIALAALLNSMAGISSSLFSTESKSKFVQEIERCTGLNHASRCVKKAQDKLWLFYRRSAQYNIYDSKNKPSLKVKGNPEDIFREKQHQRDDVDENEIFSHHDRELMSLTQSSRRCCNE